MEIAVQHKLSFLFHPFDHLLRVEYRRVQFFVWVDPLSIQVHHTQIAAIVPHNNPVRIEHRHDLEDEVLAEYLGDVGIAEQKFDYVLDNIGSHGFPWVYSRSQKNTLLLLAVIEVTDDEVVAVVACY